ncbi:histone-fold-containing protein [Hypoxylon sp. EC38]|nr:histone-fold-containing protein [Hypoxylon sp. EC38]
MKADPEVKMISAEAPILFAKGCDIFITELTMRAWIHAEENKRRTLQRSDIASALAKSDMFDFLIDIVPREEASHAKRTNPAQTQSTQGGVPPAAAGNQMPGSHGLPAANHMAPGDYGMGGHGMVPNKSTAVLPCTTKCKLAPEARTVSSRRKPCTAIWRVCTAILACLNSSSKDVEAIVGMTAV